MKSKLIFRTLALVVVLSSGACKAGAPRLPTEPEPPEPPVPPSTGFVATSAGVFV